MRIKSLFKEKLRSVEKNKNLIKQVWQADMKLNVLTKLTGAVRTKESKE